MPTDKNPEPGAEPPPRRAKIVTEMLQRLRLGRAGADKSKRADP